MAYTGMFNFRKRLLPKYISDPNTGLKKVIPGVLNPSTPPVAQDYDWEKMFQAKEPVYRAQPVSVMPGPSSDAKPNWQGIMQKMMSKYLPMSRFGGMFRK